MDTYENEIQVEENEPFTIQNKQASIQTQLKQNQVLEKAKIIIYQCSQVQKKLKSELQQKNEQYYQHVAILDQQIKELNQSIEQLKEEKKSNDNANEEKIEQLNSQIKKWEQTQLIYQQEIQTLEVEKSQIAKQLLEKLEQQKLEKKEQDEKMKQFIEILTKQNEEIHQSDLMKIDQLSEKIQTLEQEKTVYQEDQQKQIQKLQENNNKKEQEIGKLKLQIQNSTVIDNKKQEIEQFQDNETNEIYLKKLKQQAHEDKIKIEELNQKIQELSLKIKRLQPKECSYLLSREYSKKSQNQCRAIAFNQSQTLMVAGCGDDEINVFDFNDGFMYLRQTLQGHDNGYDICTLYFMKSENEFISGTYEQIGVWKYDVKTKKWSCKQMIKEAHDDIVNRVIMNNKEDLMISCGEDESIKFWINKNQWQCKQSLNKHEGAVYSICLNDSCTQLVSCGEDKQILIIQEAKEWIVVQTIKVNQVGFRICFIENNFIVFLPKQEGHLEVYQQQINEFVKFKEIPLKSIGDDCYKYFPMIYNSDQEVLLIKNCYSVHILKILDNDFKIQQTTNYKGCHVYGCMTDDGRYYITWDVYSKEFQVWKQQ